MWKVLFFIFCPLAFSLNFADEAKWDHFFDNHPYMSFFHLENFGENRISYYYFQIKRGNPALVEFHNTYKDLYDNKHRIKSSDFFKRSITRIHQLTSKSQARKIHFALTNSSDEYISPYIDSFEEVFDPGAIPDTEWVKVISENAKIPLSHTYFFHDIGNVAGLLDRTRKNSEHISYFIRMNQRLNYLYESKRIPPFLTHAIGKSFGKDLIIPQKKISFSKTPTMRIYKNFYKYFKVFGANLSDLNNYFENTFSRDLDTFIYLIKQDKVVSPKLLFNRTYRGIELLLIFEFFIKKRKKNTSFSKIISLFFKSFQMRPSKNYDYTDQYTNLLRDKKDLINSIVDQMKNHLQGVFDESYSMDLSIEEVIGETSILKNPYLLILEKYEMGGSPLQNYSKHSNLLLCRKNLSLKKSWKYDFPL